MTLALVQAVMNVIIILVLTWTGLMMSISFLLPEKTDRAENLIKNSGRSCFLKGVGMAILLFIAFVLSSLPAPILKFAGLLLIGAIGGVMALGSAGLAQSIGKRSDSTDNASGFVKTLRGSLVFSLAVGFPYLGWFVFAPVALMFALGAGVTAIFPEKNTYRTPPILPPDRPEFDLR